MQTVFIDFETYYSIDVNLKKLTYNEYIFHPDFCLHMVSIATNEGPTQVYCYDDIEPALAEIDWNNTMCVAHNTMFDGAILEWLYGFTPALYGDTQALSRFFWWTESNSLRNTCILAFPEDETLRKGEELIQSKGVSYLEGETRDTIIEYCRQDTVLCQSIWYALHTSIPGNEINIIDHTLKMFFRPLLKIDYNILEHIRTDQIQNKLALANAINIPQEVLRSNDQFAQELIKLDVTPPVKISKTTGKETYAFSKQDIEFQALMGHEDHNVRDLIQARVANKSSLMETRAMRLIQSADYHDGFLPVPMNYAPAVTRRFGGTQKVNMLNLPKNDMRKAILAPKGSMLVTADMSQIECRLLAMIANEEKILSAFREHRDIYCEFGEKIYDKPITKADYEERFISKGAVLGLGYHLGAPGFNRNIQSMAKNILNRDIILGAKTSLKIVSLYRRTYTKIPKLWRLLQGHFLSVLQGKSQGPSKFRNGILVYDKHQIHLPDGSRIQYHSGQLENTHGGHMAENVCIAHGTKIFTDSGWKLIQNITLTDLVHDGIGFVNHGGLLHNGTREISNIDGVYMTPDHEVLTKTGWTQAHESPRPYWINLRSTDHTTRRRNRWTSSFMAMPMRLWKYLSKNWLRNNSQAVESSKLRVHERPTNIRSKTNSRNDLSSSILGLEEHERSLSFTYASGVSQLRSTWNKSLQKMERQVRKLLGGHGGNLSPRAYLRENKQRRKLQLPELCLEGYETPSKQPAKQFTDQRNQSDEANWNSPYDTRVPMETRPVYDIANAGPRKRFVVKGNTAPFIVHNCQALGRILLVEAILTIQKEIAPVAFHVYDEITCVVPENKAEDIAKSMCEVLSTPMDWCADLPLDAEAEIEYYYAK